MTNQHTADAAEIARLRADQAVRIISAIEKWLVANPKRRIILSLDGGFLVSLVETVEGGDLVDALAQAATVANAEVSP